MHPPEQPQGPWTVLPLSGKITAATASDFELRLRPLIEKGTHRIALDLGGVDYMSSAGIRVVMLALKAQQAKGGELICCRLNLGLRTLFEITGLAALVQTVPDLPPANEAE